MYNLELELKKHIHNISVYRGTLLMGGKKRESSMQLKLYLNNEVS